MPDLSQIKPMYDCMTEENLIGLRYASWNPSFRANTAAATSHLLNTSTFTAINDNATEFTDNDQYDDIGEVKNKTSHQLRLSWDIKLVA